jgi:hypothetical protein
MGWVSIFRELSVFLLVSFKSRYAYVSLRRISSLELVSHMHINSLLIILHICSFNCEIYILGKLVDMGILAPCCNGSKTDFNR